MTNSYTQQALEIHNQILCLDTHEDITVTFFTPDEPRVMGRKNLCTLPLMDEGGLDGVCFAVYAPQAPFGEWDFEAAFTKAEGQFNTIKTVSEGELKSKVAIAYKSNDVLNIHRSGKKVVIPVLENGYPIGENLDNLKKLSDLGCRYITLSHEEHNQI